MAIVAAAAMVLGIGFLIFVDPIYAHLYYDVSGPGVSPVRTLTNSCADDASAVGRRVPDAGTSTLAPDEEPAPVRAPRWLVSSGNVGA